MNFKLITNKFEYLSWPEIKAISRNKRSTIIWPFGAIEQHGPHLPLATDSIFVDEIICEVLELIPSNIPIKKLPTQCMGFSPEHKGFDGTISLSSNLMTLLVKEVGIQLAEMGFKRLILINAHGGQISLLNTAARELRGVVPKLSVFRKPSGLDFASSWPPFWPPKPLPKPSQEASQNGFRSRLQKRLIFDAFFKALNL